jgi:hypothetical protein
MRGWSYSTGGAVTQSGQMAVWLVLLVGAVGCASSGSTVNAAPEQPATIFSGREAQTMYSDAPRAISRTLAIPVAAARTAVQQAFTDYSIPVTFSNPGTGQIGNADFYRSGRFMGRPMVELVSCGSGITGPNAATYRIFMSMVATVKANAQGGAEVSMTFTASARDVAGGASG